MRVSHSLNFQSREMQRFARFTVVGVAGTLVDFTTLILLKEVIGLPLLLANTLSYSAGLVNNFTLNRLWTYPDARTKAFWMQFGQFFIVSTIGLLINNGIVALLSTPLGQALAQRQIGYIAAKLVATVIVVFWNFFINRHWTFNDVE